MNSYVSSRAFEISHGLLSYLRSYPESSELMALLEVFVKHVFGQPSDIGSVSTFAFDLNSLEDEKIKKIANQILSSKSERQVKVSNDLLVQCGLILARTSKLNGQKLYDYCDAFHVLFDALSHGSIDGPEMYEVYIAPYLKKYPDVFAAQEIQGIRNAMLNGD